MAGPHLPISGSAPEQGVSTHCPYCSLQCAMTLTPREHGAGPVLEVAGAPFPTNRGGLCEKGQSSAELLAHPDRLTTPLVRDGSGARDEPFRAASWDEALQRIADALTVAQERFGPDAAGLFGGGGMTNEKAYQAGKFVRVALRSASIDYNGRFCMSSAAAAATKAFGVDRGMPFPLSDIARADTVLLVGSNPADVMPPAMRWFAAGRERGARHLVVDPRYTATAAAADVHLQPVPGTDLALANGLLHLAVKHRLVDTAYIAERTTGWPAVKRAVRQYWPDRVERITGVPVRVMERAVRVLAESRATIILSGRGAEQHAKGSDTALAWINLALALGLPGRPFSGWATMTGQGNGQGGREHGQKADQLPGYRMLADPAAREHVAGVWGVDPDELPQPGVSAYEMLDRLGTDGGVRALVVMASNVAVSAPNAAHVRERLRALDFLAVSDIFLSETAELADVVLPTTQWAEEDGTMTNVEGRVLRRRRAVDAPEGARSDLAVLADLAGRLGRGEYFDDDPRTVFDELRRASAGGKADYAGITWERIEAERGVFWPCPSEDHEGTPRLFRDGFPTPDGRARFHVVHHRDAAETPDDEFPYRLTTGRSRAHYQSGTQTRRTKALLDAEPEPTVEVHPDLAARLGVADGGDLLLRTRRGSARLRVRLTSTIRPDTVFAPFHWAGEQTINDLTNPALDPASRMPEFKVCAVELTAVPTTTREDA
ncbi:assimilatory nitrate reductase catalytic subunit [Actinomycetospora succinea]|uniref:Assimilatory nitrate reductase catalytic subunit n=1 Tax=Actinomycetospora succinea TaxID=663603 RepID=A0A4R6VID3_9PSEU|nr:molybdopterin oxidoreductase family protein [Actinomycetospora succinea]TDQ61250.1 assimilatory nitrate reductase catalytic subunit [Actinomycetospora succinea]